MNKSELIEAIQLALGRDATKRAADEALEAVLSAIAKGVKKDKKVQIAGFGTFEVRREMRFPFSGVGAAKVMSFGRRVKSAVSLSSNRSLSHRKKQIESKTGEQKCSVGTKLPDMNVAQPKLPQFSFENPKLSKADSVHLWTLNNPSTSSVEKNAGKVGSTERTQATMRLELKMSD